MKRVIWGGVVVLVALSLSVGNQVAENRPPEPLSSVFDVAENRPPEPLSPKFELAEIKTTDPQNAPILFG